MQPEDQKNRVEQEEFLENLGEASSMSKAYQAGAEGEVGIASQSIFKRAHATGEYRIDR